LNSEQGLKYAYLKMTSVTRRWNYMVESCW